MLLFYTEGFVNKAKLLSLLVIILSFSVIFLSFSGIFTRHTKLRKLTLPSGFCCFLISFFTGLGIFGTDFGTGIVFSSSLGKSVGFYSFFFGYIFSFSL